MRPDSLPSPAMRMTAWLNADQTPQLDLWEAAEAEWIAGAPRPRIRLREDWLNSGGQDGALCDETLQLLLPLLPQLRCRRLTPFDMGLLFALLMRHPAEGIGYPLALPIEPPDTTVLGTAADLADGHLRLRVPDVEVETAERLVSEGWVCAGNQLVRRPGAATRAVLDVLPHDWLHVDLELVPIDRRPILGNAVVGSSTRLMFGDTL